MITAAPKIPVGDVLLLRVLRHAFAQVIAPNRGRGRFQDVADDLLEMLPRMGDVHFLVEAQQDRGSRTVPPENTSAVGRALQVM